MAALEALDEKVAALPTTENLNEIKTKLETLDTSKASQQDLQTLSDAVDELTAAGATDEELEAAKQAIQDIIDKLEPPTTVDLTEINEKIKSLEDALAAIDLSVYAKTADLPDAPDLSPYLKTADLPEPPDLSEYVMSSELPDLIDLSPYAKTADLPKPFDSSAIDAAIEALEADDTAVAASLKTLKDTLDSLPTTDLTGYVKKEELDAAKLLIKQLQDRIVETDQPPDRSDPSWLFWLQTKRNYADWQIETSLYYRDEAANNAVQSYNAIYKMPTPTPENAKDVGNGQFEQTLPGASGKATTVTYSPTGSQAPVGNQYPLSGGTLTKLEFAAGVFSDISREWLDAGGTAFDRTGGVVAADRTEFMTETSNIPANAHAARLILTYVDRTKSPLIYEYPITQANLP
jgi:hypothetical protein